MTMITPTQAAEYLGIKLSYLYKLNTLHKVPYHKPGGGKIFYVKEDLDAYLGRGRVSADYELADQAADILNRKRGRAS